MDLPDPTVTCSHQQHSGHHCDSKRHIRRSDDCVVLASNIAFLQHCAIGARCVPGISRITGVSGHHSSLSHRSNRCSSISIHHQRIVPHCIRVSGGQFSASEYPPHQQWCHLSFDSTTDDTTDDNNRFTYRTNHCVGHHRPTRFHRSLGSHSVCHRACCRRHASGHSVGPSECHHSRHVGEKRTHRLSHWIT